MRTQMAPGNDTGRHISGFHAAPRLGQELPPHVKIGPGKLDRRCAPAVWKPPVGLEAMSRKGEIEAVEHVGQHALTEGRILQIGRHYDNLPVTIDAHLQRVTEICLRQQLVENLQMVRHPAIIIAEIGHEASTSFLQGAMAVELTLPGRLVEIEEPDAVVRGAELSGEFARRLGHAVPDDEELEVLQRLFPRALHRDTQRRDTLMSGDENSRPRHARSQPPSWRSYPPLAFARVSLFSR